MLRDRLNERRTLSVLVGAARAGESRALVVRGEPGVGKTALLDYLAEQVPGWRLERAAGVQAEMELAFAGLHQLCAPMLDQLDPLPAPQREALSKAFGLSAGNPPDRFLLGLAVLGLLAEVARDRPLLCVVDDAQWLDRASAQALAFVARRLQAESVALVFAVRDSDEVPEFTGLPELTLEGLPDDDAHALLRSAHRGPVDRRVLDRLVAEARGNPLALLELPRGFTPAELAGGFGLVGTNALPNRIEESYRRQLAPLDEGTRQLLLVAAAEPVGDPVLVWRAAQRLGITTGIGAPAAASGLVDFGARVLFRHPLVRSAIYRNASESERRSTHQALAQVTDPEADPDRRAWHAAQAAPEPDEDTAAELERSAGRAQARGGLAAAGAFLHRATELTPEPANRARRALSAARAEHQAGMPDAALRLLSLAEAGPLDDAQRAQADLLHAQIAFTVDRGGDAAALLLNAARRLEPLDMRSARDTYLEAFAAAQFAGRLARDADLYTVARAAKAAPSSSTAPTGADLLLHGLVLRFTEGYAAGAPVLKQALTAFCGENASAEEALRRIWLPCLSAVDLWDDAAGPVLAARNVELARQAGALGALPLALTSNIALHVFAGELSDAASLLLELEAVTEATGSQVAPYAALLLAAWQGDEDKLDELVDKSLDTVSRRGEGMLLSVAGWVKALVCNSLGRYQDALVAAEQAAERPEELCFSNWSLAEMVEAAARGEQPERATDALQRLTQVTQASGTDWALGIEARSRALVSDGPAAENAYREAIDRLGRTRIRGELARAHLHYGEWLRRENRRVNAREHLSLAHEMFTSMGMEAFAEGAARELAATGETVRKRSVETTSELTAQEAQIVRLVRDGLSNAEIATRLFISPRTVEWHLGKIFGKLQITSRRQLRR